MKLDVKDILPKLKPLLQKLQQYLGFIIVLLVLSMFVFVVLRIRHYASLQPSQTAIDEKLQALQRTRIDQDAIDKIEKLEGTNTDIKALFDQARDNPFQE